MTVTASSARVIRFQSRPPEFPANFPLPVFFSPTSTAADSACERDGRGNGNPNCRSPSGERRFRVAGPAPEPTCVPVCLRRGPARCAGWAAVAADGRCASAVCLFHSGDGAASPPARPAPGRFRRRDRTPVARSGIPACRSRSGQGFDRAARVDSRRGNQAVASPVPRHEASGGGAAAEFPSRHGARWKPARAIGEGKGRGNRAVTGGRKD